MSERAPGEWQMTGRRFEEDVRSLARALWSLNVGEGGAEDIQGQEIDCVCRTEDVVHLVECTVERKLEKVQRDVNKLLHAKRVEEKRGHTVKLWIVTKEEPTPDQRQAARPEGVTILSALQFAARLLDIEGYLKARTDYRFGSATDPASGGHRIAEDEYVPLPMAASSGPGAYSLETIAGLLLEGETVVLLGPFGAGKSLTVRELYRDLRRRALRDSSSPVPVALNLRDHWGQGDAHEILHRHALKTGFEKPNQLVRAWNAGRTVLLLDGFDELAAPVWRVARADRRQTRRDALTPVRAFTKQHPGGPGILVTGRDGYFDSHSEMLAAMAVPVTAFVLVLGDFDEDQAQQYLKKKGIVSDLPNWLPRKPLLLGYLSARGMLQEVVAIDGHQGPAYAWDQFLDKIAAREAAVTDDIDGSGLRRILELLAQKTRASVSGSGPLYEADLSAAYKAVTFVEPQEPAQVLLSRLPGLTARDQDDGARSFVDPEMLDALRGSSVGAFLRTPYESPGVETWSHPLGDLGCAVAALVGERAGVAPAQYQVAAKEAAYRWHNATLALDCLLACGHRCEGEPIDGGGLTIREGHAGSIDLDKTCLSHLRLEYCDIERLDVGDGGAVGLALDGCLIGRVVGVAQELGLPAWITASEVGEYDNAQTTAAILKLDVPLGVRVLLTLLKKMFLQRGSGRKETALHRGLDDKARLLVGPLLRTLTGEGLAFSSTTNNTRVWHGSRGQRNRALAIVASPATSSDPIVKHARGLAS